MFDKVSQPYTEIYDAVTGEYLGRAVFKITPEVENEILDYARNQNGSNRIVLQDLSFYPVSDDYTMPLPYEKYSRRGTFRAMFRDQNSLQWIPVEIQARFNIMERAQPPKDQRHLESVECSDIVVEGMSMLTDHIVDPKI